MQDLMKADIFFFVTTMAVILLTIGGIVVIVYLVKIVRNVKDVSEQLRKQAIKVGHDIDAMRSSGFASIWSRLIKITNIFKKRNTKHNEKKH